MSNQYWITNNQPSPKKELVRPSILQIVVQQVVAGVIFIIWSGLLVAFLQFTQAPVQSNAQAHTEVISTDNEPTPTVIPSPTSEAEPTDSPTSTAILASTETTIISQSATTPPSETPVITPTITPTEDAPATVTVTPTATITPTPPPSEDNEDNTVISFSADVLPILEKRCGQCHGGKDRIEEGLILMSYEDIMAGSWNGSVVEPGDVEGSYLIEQIVNGDMPDEGPRLLPREVEAITTWVAIGAPNN